MKFLQKKFDQLKPLFEKGGRYEKFYPIYEGHRTIFFAPDEVTGAKGTQIKANDPKAIQIKAKASKAVKFLAKAPNA